MRPELAGALCQ